MPLGPVSPLSQCLDRQTREALRDSDPGVRIQVAEALSRIGREAKAVLPALSAALTDPETEARIQVAKELGWIAGRLFDAKNTEVLPQLRHVYNALQGHDDSGIKDQAAIVKRTIDYFESLWWVELRERSVAWVRHHPYISGVVALYGLLLLM